jgi:TonB-dependent SusC/RagA subfamily outer membrane receptor
MKAILIHRVFWMQICLACLVNPIFSQDRIVYGVVHAFDSIPLIRAEVFVKSNKQTAFTDSTGRFTVFCGSKDRITIMARGFKTQKVKINEKIKIVAVNLRLKPGGKKLEYDIGYGHVSEGDRTTAASTLAKNEATFSRYSNIFEMIQGQFSGVEVRNEEIIIRGNDSFNSSSAALIVLDGVIVEADILRNLRPVEVKNISVVKDGSAAVYGSRGANGVVIIETRKGGDAAQ